MAHSLHLFSLKNRPSSASFWLFSVFFIETTKNLQQIKLIKCPSSILGWDSNSQSSDYESPHLTKDKLFRFVHWASKRHSACKWKSTVGFMLFSLKILKDYYFEKLDFFLYFFRHFFEEFQLKLKRWCSSSKQNGIMTRFFLTKFSFEKRFILFSVKWGNAFFKDFVQRKWPLMCAHLN